MKRFRVVLEIGNESVERIIEAYNFDDGNLFNYIHFYCLEMPDVWKEDSKPRRKSVALFNPDFVASIEEINGE